MLKGCSMVARTTVTLPSFFCSFENLLYAALLDAGFLTRTLAEVIQFRTTYFTVLVHRDALDEGAVHREDTLYTNVAAHLANREALLVAASVNCDHVTAELLNTLFVTFFDTVTDGYLVTCLECRKFFLLTGKCLLGYFNQIHSFNLFMDQYLHIGHLLLFGR